MGTGDFTKLRKKASAELKLWVFSMALFPLIISMFIIFFTYLELDNWANTIAGIGIVGFVSLMLIWWIWSIRILTKLILIWNDTETRIKEILNEIKDVRHVVQETMNNDE